MAGSRPDNGPIRETTLPGGLLFLSEQLPYIRSIALGLAFDVGGRDDPPGSAGIAHLIEHMVFKGTPERTARDISIQAEQLGADLNAFTDKEQTLFVGRFPGDQQGPVTELLAGIVRAPAFEAGELAKEKEVISEEIRSAEEDPDSRAANLMFRQFYGDHPMGEPVVGTHEAVAGVDVDRLRSIYSERYHFGSGIAVAVGDVDHDRLAEKLVDSLAGWERHEPLQRAPAAPAVVSRVAETRGDLSQVYLCLARPAFPFGDSRRYALSTLNNVLGGGMSSRLFQRLREDEGLVYSVSSFTELYGDSGLVGVYFVTDRRKLERCVDVLREEFDRLRRERVSREEFDRALVMTRSSMLLGLESPFTRMVRLARTHQLLGRHLTIDETLAGYERLTLEDVNGLVDEVLGDGGFHAGAVGPTSSDELAAVLERLTVP